MMNRRDFLQLTTAGAGWACCNGAPPGFAACAIAGDDAVQPPPEGASAPVGPPCGTPPFVDSDNKALWDLNRLWDKGQTLRVQLQNPDNQAWVATAHGKVKEIAAQWSRFANVNFDWADQEPCDITVNFLPITLHGTSFNSGELFSSLIGTDGKHNRGGGPSMNLLFSEDMLRPGDDFRESEVRRLVLHEFGHALGLQHEHKRPDRPIVFTRALYAHARRFWGWDEPTVNAQIVSTVAAGEYGGTVFDVDSIMMYEYPRGLAFYKGPDGMPDLAQPFRSRRNTRLTALDMVSAATAYPFDAPIIGVETLTVGGMRSGEVRENGQYGRYELRVPAAGRYLITVKGDIPALVGLIKLPDGPSVNRGVLNGIVSAAQPGPDRTELAADLQPSSDYQTHVWNGTPRKGTGKFTIRYERVA